jgi:hypothetical protein
MRDEQWFTNLFPLDTRMVLVETTGLLPGPHCDNSDYGYLFRGFFRKTCSHLQEVILSVDEKYHTAAQLYAV